MEAVVWMFAAVLIAGVIIFLGALPGSNLAVWFYEEKKYLMPLTVVLAVVSLIVATASIYGVVAYVSTYLDLGVTSVQQAGLVISCLVFYSTGGFLVTQKQERQKKEYRDRIRSLKLDRDRYRGKLFQLKDKAGEL